MVISFFGSGGGWCPIFPCSFVRNGRMHFKIGGLGDLYFFSKELYSQCSPRPPGSHKLENAGARRAGFAPGRVDQIGFWCFLASKGSPAANHACPEVPGVCFGSEAHSHLDFYHLYSIFSSNLLRRRYYTKIVPKMVQIQLEFWFRTGTTLSWPEIYFLVLGTLVDP